MCRCDAGILNRRTRARSYATSELENYILYALHNDISYQRDHLCAKRNLYSRASSRTNRGGAKANGGSVCVWQRSPHQWKRGWRTSICPVVFIFPGGCPRSAHKLTDWLHCERTHKLRSAEVADSLWCSSKLLDGAVIHLRDGKEPMRESISFFNWNLLSVFQSK